MDRRSSLTRNFINLLDRPSCRTVLASAANAYSKWKTTADVRTFHRGVWVHSAAGYLIPDGDEFAFFSNSPQQWPEEIEQWFQNAQNYWYRLYTPRAGDIIIDVGAGRGEDTLPYAKAVGPNGKVVAVEAQPSSFQLLRKLCELNYLNNVIPVHAAVCDSPGVMYAQKSAAGWRCDTVVPKSAASDLSAPVRSVTLDQLCSELHLDRIDFLKINIEGAERGALQGFSEAAAKTRFVCVCCHDFRADDGDGEQFRTHQFAKEWLSKNGFEIVSFPHTHCWERDHLHARNSCSPK